MSNLGLRNGINGLRHDHIDGSKAVLDIIDRLYEIAGNKAPERRLIAETAPLFFNDVHTDIVSKFAVVTDLLQTRTAIFELGYAYGKRRADEGYTHVHAKFAPQYHTKGGLTISEAGTAMWHGLKLAEKRHKIHIFPQFCIGREANQDVGIEVAKAVLEYEGDVGLDMACDEANNPPEKHLPAYKLTFGRGIHRDCHAGEWVSQSPASTYWERLTKNVETAVELLKCDQVGHAIPLSRHENSELVKKIVDRGVVVAGCPMSNIKTGALRFVSSLGIDELLDKGVRYTLNADDDLFLPDMTNVVEEVSRWFKLTNVHWEQLAKNAVMP